MTFGLDLYALPQASIKVGYTVGLACVTGDTSKPSNGHSDFDFIASH